MNFSIDDILAVTMMAILICWLALFVIESEVSASEFEDWYSRGLPACAYEIIPAPKLGRASWLNWLYDWFFRKIT